MLAEFLREADRDRYVAALFAPPGRRDGLMALYAFNAELARLRDGLREPMAGELRLQWWLDAINGGTSTETAGHPVADRLRQAIEQYRLPVSALVGMIEARRFDLYDDPMPDRNHLEGYCGETAGALIQLASIILDPDAAAEHGADAGHAGCAQAIAGLLALLPRHRARGQCYIPADILAATGASPELLREIVPPASAHAAVEAMVALGRQHLAAFLDRAGKLPDRLRPAYLPLSVTGRWLDAIERAGAAVFDHSIEIGPVRKRFAMLHRALRGWS